MTRGKYRRYNEKTSYVKERIHDKMAMSESTFSIKLAEAMDMRSRVNFERFKHFVGETIIINRIIESNEKERTVGGVVVGLYPHFLLIDCGNYKTSISYKDLCLGGRT